MLALNEKVEPEPSRLQCTGKKKAIAFESSLKRLSMPCNKRVSFSKDLGLSIPNLPDSSIPCNKRVSFSKKLVLPRQELPSLDAIDSSLQSNFAEISECQDVLDNLKAVVDASSNDITLILKNLSESLGVTREISENELNYVETLLACETIQLQSFEEKRYKLVEILNEKEQKLMGELGELEEQKRSLESSIRMSTKEDAFRCKTHDVYKDLLKQVGISVKNTRDDHIILCNKSEFTFTPTGTSYLLTPNRDKMALFAKGTHKICRSQLKFLTFRLLDN